MVKKSKKKTKKKIKSKKELIEEPSIQLKKEKREIKPEIGPHHLTKYERARIIGARALQISMSAPILLDEIPDIKDPIQIAEMELEQRLLPITVRRKLPDGKYEDIPLIYLLNHGY
ncbi:MAG: DNA-directed RNA polymerase subunit K [Candidatus Helarchaeota archaeon]|nr:DNA-directed RNA polymerase subunit K [Candidatus Helarchaeota archaeon]